VWGRFSARAAAEGWPKRALILQLLEDYATGRIRPSTRPPQTVTVYYYEIGDLQTGENVRRGPATLEAITMARGRPLFETGDQVALSEIDGDGFAARLGEADEA
jgi:hypothetical protein